MKCPVCQSDTKVIDSRNHIKGTCRRRECLDCLTRFTTYEKIEMKSLDKHLLARLGGYKSESLCRTI